MHRALSFAVVVCASTFGFAQSYQVVDLGANSTVTAINNSGQAVGYRGPAGNAFRHNVTTAQVAELGLLGYPTDINENGVIVGSNSLSRTLDAWGWYYVNGVHTQLQSNLSTYSLLYPGFQNVTIYSVDDSDRASGMWRQNNLFHAVQFGLGNPISNPIQDLGTLNQASNPPPYSFALNSNNAGQVVGTSGIGLAGGKPFLFSGGTMTPLSVPSVDHFGDASDINASGVAVGFALFNSISGQYDAIRWQGGTHNLLGRLPAPFDEGSVAGGINDQGVVVGYGLDIVLPSGPHPTNAFVYDGQLQNLNLLIDQSSGWVLETALDVNNSGIIIGQGKLQGVPHAFALVPIPEPAVGVTAMLVVGLFRFSRVARVRST